MTDKADVTFSMTAEDLEFLVFAMKFLEGGIEQETLRAYWQTVFERTLDEEFPVAEENTPNPPDSAPSSKRIVIEFVGGFKDGQRYSTASDDPQEVQLAVFTTGFLKRGRLASVSDPSRMRGLPNCRRSLRTRRMGLGSSANQPRRWITSTR